ncbi:MAG: NFACT RNA binding domain-containing protein [Clostridia bacterium]|nr:NFACT RNA binding domain-containing protein [Clostridia bacterium]
MPQDAFTISYVAKELKEKLIHGKISRIVQPAREELTFIIYTGSGNVKLDANLSARGARLSLSEDEKPVPQVAPNYCMLLRKHLQNAEILDIKQHGFERIIYFDLKCVSDFSSSVMRLYFEIMGKYSNAVLCGGDGTIIGALKTTSIGDNTKRLILGGVKYALPEPQDKILPNDVSALKEVLKTEGDKAKIISDRITGISYATALEAVECLGENLTAEQLYGYLFEQTTDPCVTFLNGEPADFKVRSCSHEQVRYSTILEAQAAYYSYTYKKQTFQAAKTKAESALCAQIKKVEKRLAEISSKLVECEGAEKIKLKGELITANIYAIERGAKTLECINYYDPEGGRIKIELDPTLTPSQNAQKYYKKYAKLKRTLLSVSEQKAQAEKKLDYLKSISAHLNAAEEICDLEEISEELVQLGFIKAVKTKNKKTAVTPYRTYEFRGFKIIAGRNNLQNERLTKSLAQDDIWLHTQKYHSSHVAIITDGREVADGVIKTAAEICAYYSDGREGAKIPVDYVKKKFVKKPPKTDAGFVIYTDYKTALAEPDAHRELLKEDL